MIEKKRNTQTHHLIDVISVRPFATDSVYELINFPFSINTVIIDNRSVYKKTIRKKFKKIKYCVPL